MSYSILDPEHIGPAFQYADTHNLNLNDLIALIGHYVAEVRESDNG